MLAPTHSLARCASSLDPANTTTPHVCPQIKTTQLMRDRETDKFKGFAFVEFATVGDLEQALEVSGAVSRNLSESVNAAWPS